MNEHIKRCQWALRSDEEILYHDTQWGRPVFDDELLFEMLVLEMMQAGLSWTTILKKREAMTIAFEGFDVQKIAKYNEAKILELLENKEIIRNRRKLEAMVNNAKCFINVQREHGSFSEYLWSQVNHQVLHNGWTNEEDIPSSSPLSNELSKDLKRKGFKFVGPIIMYAYLQAVGVINDHLKSCFCYDEIAHLRS